MIGRVLLGLVFISFFLLILSNGLALTFWPRWAVKQPWSLLNEQRLRRQRTFPFGIIVLAAESPVLGYVWIDWVAVLAGGLGFRGLAWAFSPGWLMTKFPSTATVVPSTKAGIIAMRIFGYGMLVVFFGFLLATGAFFLTGSRWDL